MRLKKRSQVACLLINNIVLENIMEDVRCCGSGTCIINAEGFCWCGQQWNGTRMCFPEPASDTAADVNSVESSESQKINSDPSAS